MSVLAFKVKKEVPVIANDNDPVFMGYKCTECNKVTLPTTYCLNCGARLKV